jgi:Protein of unknown function (DUF1571)
MSAVWWLSRTGNVGRREFLAVAGAGALSLWPGPIRAEAVQMAARIDQAPQTHALIPALRTALVALDAARALKDYDASFTKIELIGRQTLTTRMQVKVRHTPFSVYIKFIEPHAGREAIYVSGKNNNQVVVHDTGLAALVGTLSLDPTGATAMEGNRHPITTMSLPLLVEGVMGMWLTQARQNATGITVNNFPNSKIGEQNCQTIETVLAQPIGTDSFQTTRLYLDAATKLPVRVQQYAFPTRRGQKPVLVEDYLYQNLKTNISLADIDFDAQNPRYGY